MAGQRDNPRNSFYSQTIDSLVQGKDSNLEFAKIITYSEKRLVARVYTLHSKQYKDDVPVLFPSLFLNMGNISPPAEGSTSLLFWGADRQPFILPMQIVIPRQEVDADGTVQMNASPDVYDELLTLKNIQGGEHLIRSLGGSYLFLKNNGTVELGTEQLHRFGLNRDSGMYYANANGTRQQYGNSHYYFGSISDDDTRTHVRQEIAENNDVPLQPTDDKAFLNDMLNGHLSGLQPTTPAKLFSSQRGHVIEGNEVVHDPNDLSELFSKNVLTNDNAERTETLSKKGRQHITVASADSEVEIAYSSDMAQLTKKTTQTDGTIKETSVGIDEQGDIVCQKDGKKFELFPMLEWFYEQQGGGTL